MAKVSEKRRMVVKVAKEEFRDSRGVAFDKVRFQPSIVGLAISFWPKIVRTINPNVLDDFRRLRQRCQAIGICWNCEAIDRWSTADRPGIDIHHLAESSRGRSDELCLLTSLCRSCHEIAGTKKLPLGRLIYLKWKNDRANTDYVRLCLALRTYLPDLITGNSSKPD